MRFKKVVKSDIEENLGVNKMTFKGDLKMESAPKKRFPIYRTLIIVGCVALIAIALIPVIKKGMEEILPYNVESVRSDKKFSLNEKKVAIYNSKLNEVNYPKEKGNVDYSEIELDSYLDYSYLFYKENAYKSYAPSTLYGVLHNLSNALKDEELINKTNNVLGLNNESRDAFYRKIVQNNHYANDNGTSQINNAAFFNKILRTYKQSYIDKLTNTYTEAFNLDFSNSGEVDEIVKWVNSRLNDDKFIDRNFLQMNEETVLYLFSTLYFSQNWNHLFVKEDTVTKPFQLEDGTKVNKKFMTHSYMTSKYYDYDSYISFNDYYTNGNSIQYITTKNANDDIKDIIKDVNFLKQDEEKAVGTNSGVFINLSVPSFKEDSEINFNNILNNLGLNDYFNYTKDPFSEAFEPLEDHYTYLQVVKQKNSVTLNEDGTIVKSVAMATVGDYATSAGPDQEIYLHIELNHPFIYVIKDFKGLPLYIGYMNNPNQ
ncbi:MAG: hypothetical protein K6C32_05345 [Bacilli bacterium]|nr:hypothetical protein [Bacilli bacterium]